MDTQHLKKCNMEPFVFLDNDRQELAEADMDSVLDKLEDIGILLSKQDIQIVSDLHRLPEKELEYILYDRPSTILTYSMFTTGHFNSKGQLLLFLITAGGSEVVGRKYINTSGALKELFDNYDLNSLNRPLQVLHAIQTNYIIDLVWEGNNLVAKRAVIDFNRSYFKGCIKWETINLNIDKNGNLYII